MNEDLLRQFIEDNGGTIDLITVSAGGSVDSFGDPVLESTTESVVAIKDMGRGQVDRYTGGVITTGQAMFYIDSEEAVYDENGTYPTRIKSDGVDYVTIQADDLGNGVMAILAERTGKEI